MTAADLTVLTAVAAPLLLPAAARSIRADLTPRAATAGAGLGLVASIVLLAANATGDPISLTPFADSPSPGLHVDRVSALLFLMIGAVLVTVQGFAVRYLHGDPRSARFSLLAAATGSAMLVATSASTLTVLVVGWCAAGILLCLLLLHRGDLEEARLGARRTAASLAIGDGALIAALAIVLATGPDVDLTAPAAAAESLSGRELGGMPADALVAALIGVCAAARSALVPFHRWLPSTLSAPTPVSAILHAGLVNGAGLLLITLAPIVALAPAALWILLGLGLLTTLLGTAMGLVRSDVKGSLAWSTSAQMGFMVAQCATGGFAAALLHILGHGIYKANLFLGSGSAVSARRRSASAPQCGPAIAKPGRIAIAALLPTALFAAALTALAPDLLEQTGVPILIGFALATAIHSTWSWLSASSALGARAVSVGLGLLAVAIFGYVGAVAVLEGFVEAEVAAIAIAAPPAWVVPLAIGGAAAAATIVRFLTRRSERLADLELTAWAIARNLSGTAPMPTQRAEGRSPEPISLPRPATIGGTR